MRVFDHTRCHLGEGPLWHPERQSLFWFDILNKRMFGEGAVHQFEVHVSAAGWIDQDCLLVASEHALFSYNLDTRVQVHIAAIEADNPVTRSNDGRADPFGGFWIGSMGKRTERGAGAIHRYYRGTVETLFENITVANAICFSPDGKFAHYTDTTTQQVMHIALDAEGWPEGGAHVFVDTRAEGFFPDGAVMDVEGCLWVAHWGHGRVARYDPQGVFIGAVSVPAVRTTCPAFGGADNSTLFVTTATMGMGTDAGPQDGKTFMIETNTTGQREHRVIL